MSSFDFKQFEQFAKKWEDGQKKFQKFLKQFLLDLIVDIANEAKSRSPVDTGALEDSWSIGEKGFIGNIQQGDTKPAPNPPEAATIEDVKVVGNSLEIKVWSSAYHAQFVEYGHNVVSGGSIVGFVDGRFMLKVSVDEVMKRMPAKFHDDFKVWLSEIGMV